MCLICMIFFVALHEHAKMSCVISDLLLVLGSHDVCQLQARSIHWKSSFCSCCQSHLGEHPLHL